MSRRWWSWPWRCQRLRSSSSSWFCAFFRWEGRAMCAVCSTWEDVAPPNTLYFLAILFSYLLGDFDPICFMLENEVHSISTNYAYWQKVVRASAWAAPLSLKSIKWECLIPYLHWYLMPSLWVLERQFFVQYIFISCNSCVTYIFLNFCSYHMFQVFNLFKF